VNLDNKEVPGEMAAMKMDYELRGAEMSQARWFASMRGVPFWTATLLCARAAFGDVVSAAIAFTVSAALARGLSSSNRRMKRPLQRLN